MGVEIISGIDSNGLPAAARADGKVAAISTSGYRSTYCYRGADIIPATNPTDVLTLTGSATKVIRITKVGVTGKATAAAMVDLYLGKRSTPDTGGTSTNPTPSKYDSTESAATGILTLYSVNPTAGTGAAAFEGDMIYLPAAATPAGSPTHWEREYGGSGTGAKCPTLRGVNESFYFSFGGATLPAGANFYFYIEWTEDDV